MYLCMLSSLISTITYAKPLHVLGAFCGRASFITLEPYDVPVVPNRNPTNHLPPPKS